jgi:hypothetical protein
VDQELESVVRKVRKLLAHGEKNQNEHEAGTAMLMARKLMEEHDLALTDVQVAAIEKSQAIDKEAGYSRYLCPWERQVAMCCSFLFDTYTYSWRRLESDRLDHYFGKEVFSMRFIGLPEDVSLSLAAYETLRDTLRRMGEYSPFRGTDQRTYLLGVASRLTTRARKMRDDFAAQQASAMGPAAAGPDAGNSHAGPAVPNCTALILVKQRLIDEIKPEGLRKGRRPRVGGSAMSYAAGKRDGEGVSLGFRSEIR